MDLERAGDLECLARLEQIICGDKMIGVEAAAIAMKKDAERWRKLEKMPFLEAFLNVLVLGHLNLQAQPTSLAEAIDSYQGGD